MPEYEDQHFYPLRFLKKFSPDSENIWMFDGYIQKFVPITSQCQKDNFYSSVGRKETENLMERGESLLDGMLKRKVLTEYSQA